MLLTGPPVRWRVSWMVSRLHRYISLVALQTNQEHWTITRLDVSNDQFFTQVKCFSVALVLNCSGLLPLLHSIMHSTSLISALHFTPGKIIAKQLGNVIAAIARLIHMTRHRKDRYFMQGSGVQTALTNATPPN